MFDFSKDKVIWMWALIIVMIATFFMGGCYYTDGVVSGVVSIETPIIAPGIVVEQHCCWLGYGRDRVWNEGHWWHHYHNYTRQYGYHGWRGYRLHIR